MRLEAAGSTAVELVGAKAASLARSGAAGLPALPGFVLTTALDPSRLADEPATQLDAIRAAWRHLSNDGRDALVVRSSATKEDSESSSMAGLFVSKLDVVGGTRSSPRVERCWPRRTAWRRRRRGGHRDGGARAAVPGAGVGRRALRCRSGDRAHRPHGDLRRARRPGPPRQRRARRMDGDADPDGPHHRGCGDGDRPDDGPARVDGVGAAGCDLAGRPQDIEWAIDDGGTVRLLQSRPITTLHGPVGGPIYGPGPLAETFPDPLAPLEEDLWLAPLRDGLRHALGLLGSVTRRSAAARAAGHQRRRAAGRRSRPARRRPPRRRPCCGSWIRARASDVSAPRGGSAG